MINAYRDLTMKPEDTRPFGRPTKLVKWPGREYDHFTSIPSYTFMTCTGTTRNATRVTVITCNSTRLTVSKYTGYSIT